MVSPPKARQRRVLTLWQSDADQDEHFAGARGTSRSSRTVRWARSVSAAWAAAGVGLDERDLAELDAVPPAVGDRY
jgi:hypothetical protein